MQPGPEVQFYQVDAFTDNPFGGNPAAVCVLKEPLLPRSMQLIAAEMNLSETAFPEPADQEGIRRLRWFTPTVEVPLCGHATLATSHVLIREKGEESPVRFNTASGILTVHAEDDGYLRMDFPANPPTPCETPAGVLEALGCGPGAQTLRSEMIMVVRLDNEAAVAAVEPDFTGLVSSEPGEGILGVAVTAPGEGDTDFVSRFFAPWVGVAEDPVTGVAHTTLTPYWAGETGSATLKARQISRRGGFMKVELSGDRVYLRGKAVTVARGCMILPPL
jgi:PhzF family phenazine biosynthesis protein